MTLRRLLCPAVLCLAAVGVPAATALADTEPNDALVQAEGPISGGTDIKGTLGTRDDVDWYVFYVQGQQQIHLTSSAKSAGSYCGAVSLYDTDGSGVSDDFTTPPGTNRYFAQVSDESSFCPTSTNYTFKVDPGGAVVSGPSIQRAQGTGEPNETADQPAGPLSQGTPYSGSIDTSNDEDWFFFYTAPGTHPVDLAVTGPALDNCSVYASLKGPNGDEIQSVNQDSNSVSHIKFTSQLAGRYLIQMTGSSYCIPAHWQFELDSPDPGAVTTTAPGDSTTPVDTTTTDTTPSSGPSTACRNARARVRKDLKTQRSVKRQLRHAHGAKRRRLGRKLNRVRKDLHRAVGRRRLDCG